MKRWLMTLMLVGMLLLTACATMTADKPEHYIGPAELSESERALANLLGENYPQQVFDFAVPETVESMSVRVLQLLDGQWVPASGGGTVGVTYTGQKGRIALDYDTLGDGVKVSIQKDGGIYRMERTVPEQIDTAGLSRAQTWLSQVVEIVPGQEIPLAIQILSSQLDIPLWGPESFAEPEKYAGHEHVFVVTVTFNEQDLGE